VLADWRSAPVPDRLRAALGLLAGEATDALTDEEVEDALTVAALFDTITRIADALGFELPPSEYFAGAAPGFLERGYL
jgi:hypothetical protein